MLGNSKERNGGGGNGKLFILAFPINDFHQEPGTNGEIKEKVRAMLGPELFENPHFVLFQKSSLHHNPVYELLQKHMPGKRVKHNFFKYVIDANGIPTSFHSKKETLLEMKKDISKVLSH